MRKATLVIAAALPCLAACATHPHQSASAVKRSIDAVVTDESQHQKVVGALQAGEKPADALAKASDGPKDQKPVPQ
ncbi:MAG: hypothetical protein JSR98_17840 [Proteobacteria bacterium]|nr:hypothetical protein [Pseudomonadota bacterium]